MAVAYILRGFDLFRGLTENQLLKIAAIIRVIGSRLQHTKQTLISERGLSLIWID